MSSTTGKRGPESMQGPKPGSSKRQKREYQGRKHADRRRSTRPESESAAVVRDEGGGGGEPKEARLPKRMCALLIGFCGTGCYGMQIQPNVRTIEGILFDALVKAGAVSKDNADDPVKVGLQRAARTDAGVHAAGNVVSLKLITVIPDLLAKINQELPPQVRLWGYVRVQNSFNARSQCDSRKYTYFFPSYVLLPPSTAEDEGTSTPEQVLAKKRAWRVDAARLERLRAIADKFVGTHNFHNFTVGRDFKDPSTQRFMKTIEVADPVVYGQTEWISVMFHGQSFMLHQIRKMMSALVLTCRTETPKEIIDELYGPKTVLIPKMPSLGLLLEHPIFDSYNSKVMGLNEKIGNDTESPEYRPPILFETHRESIDAFKQEYIYDTMRATEDRAGVFDAWIRSIDSYGGGDLGYLNPKGTIPDSSVIKRGQRRQNPFKEKKKFDTTDYSAVQVEEAEEEEEEEEEAEVAGKNKALLAEMEG